MDKMTIQPEEEEGLIFFLTTVNYQSLHLRTVFGWPLLILPDLV